ncbi:uncharacterized protein A1O5_01185 [Cladophialophora psammophila CBS 110553]|uniref:Uncharacterized protein n=1 Tax=Cladophialophora psammophila CBS 110553 TaxID=1182543 RepID=W9X870_9EURO|nr:uncharacterized protein A1O5_01185 [Cladophialophora psammophila CBS 110553]EXJ76677.1 hypothetical protein A1O5_01185 [Cladophialophora psammophila CBS 110553]
MLRRSPIPWVDSDSNLHWYDPETGYDRRSYDDDQGTSYKKTPNSKGHSVRFSGSTRGGSSAGSDRGRRRRRRRGDHPGSRALSAVFSGVYPRNPGSRSGINIEGPFYDEDYDRWDYYDIGPSRGPRRLEYCRHGEVEVLCECCNDSHGRGGRRGPRGRSPPRESRSRSRSRSRDRHRHRGSSNRRRHGRHWVPRDDGSYDEVIACYVGDFDYDFYDEGPPPRHEHRRRPSSSRRRRRRPGPPRGDLDRDREWGFGHGACGLEPMYDGLVFDDSGYHPDFIYDYDYDFDYDGDFGDDDPYGGHRRRRRRGSIRNRDRRDREDDIWREMDRVERRADEAERWLWREYGA